MSFREHNKRRHLSGRETGSGAGAPRSLQDQQERNEASRRQTAKIIQPAVERILALREQAESDKPLVQANLDPEFDDMLEERRFTQRLGGVASNDTKPEIDLTQTSYQGSDRYIDREATEAQDRLLGELLFGDGHHHA